MNRSGRLAAAAALALVLPFPAACRRRPDSQAAAYVRSLARTEAPLEHAWRRFDAAAGRGDWEAARSRARVASSAAARARAVLEREPVPPELSVARREELVFLNHAVLGFQDFDGRGGGRDELEILHSTLRRGRAHQALGRESLH